MDPIYAWGILFILALTALRGLCDVLIALAEGQLFKAVFDALAVAGVCLMTVAFWRAPVW